MDRETVIDIFGLKNPEVEDSVIKDMCHLSTYLVFPKDKDSTASRLLDELQVLASKDGPLTDSECDWMAEIRIRLDIHKVAVSAEGVEV